MVHGGGMGAPPLEFVGPVSPGSDIFGARAEVLGHGLRTAWDRHAHLEDDGAQRARRHPRH